MLHTSEEIARRTAAYIEKTYSGKTAVHNLRAFIGLMYLAGHVNMIEFWSEIFGSPVFRASMSITHFEFLTFCIQFNDRTSKPERKRSDGFSAIREIWDVLIVNCKMHYTPTVYCAVDEQLLGVRGRCPFRVYIQNKPDKYGIVLTLRGESSLYGECNTIHWQS